ncbi:MAG: GlsB/YeaQ/YmgE family stress response membrane protein [Anaerolineales bacterium]|nr:GlsB/YeaQ/YmgE family stress response membrane protein [Anaerolineales bacterium]MCS7246683.1 GlsB/YeaQ/YmgE family stress response membrane protein [Anaerolineales bacterium]MDW8160493.1 GlsB/YeaQ/YmgE family stress response membrane protein [Anaerolineales bacterium]MDW8446192.1 GlsB/YeaQ/YmgE family stress response membrane protein [Anaerolineales bacterium]
MDITNLLWFVVIGFIAGWVATRLMRKSSFGLLGNVIVGVLGAVIGGYIFDVLRISASGLLGSLVTAIVGAVVLLYLISLAKKI